MAGDGFLCSKKGPSLQLMGWNTNDGIWGTYKRIQEIIGVSSDQWSTFSSLSQHGNISDKGTYLLSGVVIECADLFVFSEKLLINWCHALQLHEPCIEYMLIGKKKRVWRHCMLPKGGKGKEIDAVPNQQNDGSKDYFTMRGMKFPSHLKPLTTLFFQSGFEIQD